MPFRDEIHVLLMLTVVFPCLQLLPVGLSLCKTKQNQTPFNLLFVIILYCYCNAVRGST